MELWVKVAIVLVGVGQVGCVCLLPYFLLSPPLAGLLLALCGMTWLRGALYRHYTDNVQTDGRAVLVTGCDTGFGHDAAGKLDECGFVVFAGCLQPEGPGAKKLKASSSARLRIVPLDVTNDESVQNAYSLVAKHLPKKGLWGLLNNAGMYVMGDVEWCPLTIYRRVMELNVYGNVRMIRTFLPLIRKTKGRVVIVSSVKGRYCGPADVAYHISKHGLETLGDCLRLEMIKFGVGVSLIEPGNYSNATSSFNQKQADRYTAELEEMWKAGSEDARSVYGRKYLEDMLDGERAGKLDSHPNTRPVVSAMEHALVSGKPKTRYLVPGGSGMLDTLAVLARFYGYLPSWLSDWIVTWLTGCHKLPTATSNKDE